MSIIYETQFLMVDYTICQSNIYQNLRLSVILEKSSLMISFAYGPCTIFLDMFLFIWNTILPIIDKFQEKAQNPMEALLSGGLCCMVSDKSFSGLSGVVTRATYWWIIWSAWIDWCIFCTQKIENMNFV